MGSMRIPRIILSCFIFLLIFFVFQHNVNAVTCRVTSDCSGACGTKSATCKGGTCICTTTSPAGTCASWSPCRQDGAKCYQTRMCYVDGKATSYQISECACPSTGGGGGGTAPTPVPPTATPKPVAACVDTDGGSVPNVYGEVRTSAPALAQVLKDSCLTNVVTKNADGSSTSRWVSGETGTHVGEKTCTNTSTGAYADTVLACQYGCQSGACRASAATPTPVISCMSRTDCPSGYRCYQPPMPTCPAGRMCPEVMPARYCIPDTCTLHSKGDANCDGVVNDIDYTIWKRLVQNPSGTTDGFSADFNSDQAVTIVDFEIWRATRHN